MADILPSTSDLDGPESDDPRVIGVDSDAADDLLAALSSRTARRLLSELHEEPGSASDLADRVDTSLQNAQYHLEKLESADLIEVGDTVYSEKGREMKVYVPVDRALVVVAGREEDTTGLQTTLGRLLGGVGVLGAASLVVDRLAGGPTSRLFTSGGAGAGGGGDAGGAQSTSGGSGSADDGAAGGAESTTTDTSVSVESTDVETATPEPTSTTSEPGISIAEETTQAATETPQATAEPTATAAPEATQTATETAARVTDSAVRAADPTLLDSLATSPGVLFFLGGLTVLLVGILLLRARR
ncbi:Helix-turn-helix domain-containing protein [Halogranum gelatinilyticum]|uniref:Helix-turn-helix domain-containing protein n=1 Tax=Halogranum gelatinilyticum TaxID=660521 RepID=A0A1G9PHR0_9EURY|nr:winged helix-turn-helix domain-containing protein [Halogranum gelatinilyticum]SDL98366.1 Helix-turn-helix domain-containing protein [Halogranum gelatinilyticum]